MKKKEITITVSAMAGSGKSTIILLLKEFLREKGFDVSFDGGIDFNNSESRFDFHLSKNLDEKIKNIRSNTKITVKEEQFKRTDF